MFKKRMFAYENSDGDKGVIIASSYRKAEKIYRKEYPDRKLVDIDTDDYYDEGAYLFDMGKVCNGRLYNAFPW